MMCCKKHFLSYILKNKCLYYTYSSFLVVNVCNQGKTLCSPFRNVILLVVARECETWCHYLNTVQRLSA